VSSTPIGGIACGLKVASPTSATVSGADNVRGVGTLAEAVAENAERDPEGIAFITDPHRLTWHEYQERAHALATVLVSNGFDRGDRVAVMLPDGPAVHVAYLALEQAGLVIVGIGPRAGAREIEHLIASTGARVLIAPEDASTLASQLGVGHLPFDDNRAVPSVSVDIDGRRPGLDELWLLNSTSGTTGLPKCVMHHQARWFAFHELAVEAGALSSGDVFMSVLPAPFGFGIWTAHFTPTLLGAPTVVMPRFDPDECLALIERERVSVLAAVSTQFVMLLDAPSSRERDLSSLRVMFTGGEMVPYQRAAEFEDRTGCAVLQFYGSNETGALSRTTLRDDRDQRLRTAGRIIPDMHVRLFDEAGDDVTSQGGPGVAACKGPLTCLGYYADEAANAQLVRPHGWMLTGDVCTIDDGYLTVAGRASDFIIRGGKNISAAVVEDEVSTHPDVSLAAAVAMPDPVFGERVCTYVELRAGSAALSLDELREHLATRGVGKELWPERIVVVDALPRASGGKIAKGELRDDIRRRLSEEQART
jgi:acyl-CoA synthetase